MGKKKSIFPIRWQLLSLILPVAIAPLIIIVGFTTNQIFLHLEEKSKEFYSSILIQISNNIDFMYEQYARTLTNIVRIPNVEKGLSYPPYKSETEEMEVSDMVKGKNTIYKGNRVISEGLRKTAEEKIDGDVYLYELDRKSVINNADYMVHKLNLGLPDPDVRLMLEDPLFKKIKNDNQIKMIFGKFKDNVLKGTNCESKPVMIFPYYYEPPENPDDTFEKFILIQIFPDFIPKFYSNISHIKQGTLYILDQFNNIVSFNHPSNEDYYEFDYDKNQYVLNDDDPNDPYEKMSFREYKLLNVDKNILNVESVKKLTDKLTPEGYNEELDKEEDENIFNQKHIIRYKGIDYMTALEYSKSSGCKLIYFHPMFQIHKPVYNIIKIIVIIAIITIIIILFISIVFSKSFTEPIRNLVTSAQKISGGNYKTSVQIDNFNGEFYILGSTFNDMASKIDDYSENLEQMVRIRTKEINDANEKMKRELVMAQNIQQAIIPKVFPKVGILQISGFYQPMADLGGDFYDVFMLDKNRIVFVIVDVCGHGVPAALITTMAKVSFFNNSRDQLKTSDILTLVNEEICGAIGENNSYFTAFYGIFDIKSKILEYTNAGHNEIAILKNDKSIVLLDSNSGFVGMLKGLKYKTDYVTLDTGDKLILYTDGIPEARNTGKELYGFDRFKKSIIKHSDLSLEDMIKNIIDDAKEFRGDFRVDDDMTILVVQILPDSVEININLADIANKIKVEIDNTVEGEFTEYKNQILTAINCFNESLYDESIEILRNVDKYFNRKKEKFDILYLLGCNYYKNKDFKNALEFFEKANSINSEDESIKKLINILKTN